MARARTGGRGRGVLREAGLSVGVDLSFCQTVTLGVLALLVGWLVLAVRAPAQYCLTVLPLTPSYPGLPPPFPPPYTPSTIGLSFLNAPALSGSLRLSLSMRVPHSYSTLFSLVVYLVVSAT